MAEILNPSDAIALAEIIRAAQRKATVGWLNWARDRVNYGEAQYIGGPSLKIPDYAAEDRADIRDLYLHVRGRFSGPVTPENAYSTAHYSLQIGELIGQYREGSFIVDFDLAAFEAAGGQASVPAHVAAWEDAQRVPPARTERPDFWALMRARPELTAVQMAQMADPKHIRQARGWIADTFSDVDVAGLTDAEVVDGIRKHYTGGWGSFVADGGPVIVIDEGYFQSKLKYRGSPG